MKEKSAALFDAVRRLRRGGSAEDKLPENVWFLDDGVACFPSSYSESRYPYGTDGFTLWAYRSGYLCVNESTFTLFPYADEGKQPYLAFFAGLKDGEEFIPYSLTGAAAQPREKAERCTVFTPSAAYYLVDAGKVRFALRITVDREKRILATISAQNLSDAPQEIALTSYVNCLMRYMAVEDVESKWYKRSARHQNGFLVESVVDLSRDAHVNFYAAVCSRPSGKVLGTSATASRADFAGGRSVSLNCSPALFAGRFGEERAVCGFTDTAIAGEIVRYALPVGGYCEQDLTVRVFTDAAKARECLSRGIAAGETDEIVRRMEEADEQKQRADGMLKMRFGEFTDGRLNGSVFEKFVRQVVRQVEYCALAKTSSLAMLGVRDVFQQIEAALVWDAPDCRRKMLEALSFIGVDGRVPRQYSLPASKESVPVMDLREFIDQGVWILDAVYTYLAYTGDYAFLREECGYYIYRGREVFLTEERGSVLDHLLRIADYLIGCIDEKTGCLRILFGDWNDALDGLGISRDGKGFGSGVSVMATLQLRHSLGELAEVLKTQKGFSEKADSLLAVRASLDRGLRAFAVEEKGGERRILHGWGDGRSYLVGSFCDVDGKARDALTANAFWVLSGMYAQDRSLKETILRAYDRLDSKYGLKTFDPPFERGTRGVGRIPNLPKGTAENGATYVHATLFAIWSLFKMGEAKRAWEQLFKILPPTHEHISTSPFVMSNSYVYNPELGADGESMSDWYTGSAAVLIKVLSRCVFGVEVSQEKLTISPAAHLPCAFAEAQFCIRGKHFSVRVERKGEGVCFFVNGKVCEGVYEEALLSASTEEKTDDLSL